MVRNMQKERSIYEAASRAVQHQREADGSKKAKPAHEPEPVTCAGNAISCLCNLVVDTAVC